LALGSQRHYKHYAKSAPQESPIHLQLFLPIVPNMGTCYSRVIVRVIARSTIKRFIERTHGRRGHAALRSALEAWFTEARKAQWKNSAEVKKLYATASIVSSDRLAFNIKGNDYRLVVGIDYEKGIVWIKWIGTHAEYDGIDVRTVNYEESKAASK